MKKNKKTIVVLKQQKRKLREWRTNLGKIKGKRNQRNKKSKAIKKLMWIVVEEREKKERIGDEG